MYLWQLEIMKHDASKIILLSQDCFGCCFGIFHGFIQIVDCLFYFFERCFRNFERGCIEPVDQFGQCGHFNHINAPVQEHRMSLHLFVLYILPFLSRVSFNFQCVCISPSWLNSFLGILFFWEGSYAHLVGLPRQHYFILFDAIINMNIKFYLLNSLFFLIVYQYIETKNFVY